MLAWLVDVSILVLMEDVKEQTKILSLITFILCFNPCFNGRCKRTLSPLPRFFRWIFVSILVLMEDVKEPFTFKIGMMSFFVVSILVLMEDVKEPKRLSSWRRYKLVSILVLMEDVKERFFYFIPANLYQLFQSLF